MSTHEWNRLLDLWFFMLFMFLSLFNIVLAEPTDPFSDLENSVAETKDFFSILEKNYTKREGVLGAVAAGRLYNKALRAFMLENYEEATLLFFVLVKDNSLRYDTKLHHKAQWFLIESADAFGRTLLLEEECLIIIDEEGHPFFPDAVRRLLELYGRTGRDEDFQKIVSKYVDTGKVKSTHKIQYTLGKSYYWQNKTQESRDLLSKIPKDSVFYDRSQYFVGGTYASSGEFEQAMSFFTKVEERLQNRVVNDKVFISDVVEIGTAEDQKVYELSILAQGRVLLEMGEYDKAIAAYARVPSTSSFYPDVVYELVWVYIKNKSWEDASRMIDVFLYGYPEHEYAIRLELIRGRIQMNAGNNEQASKTFNDSKKSLKEVDVLLRDLIGNEQAALNLFFSLRDAQSADPFSVESFQEIRATKNLPHYAKEILKGEKDLLKAIDMSKTVQSEYQELEEMKVALQEMKELILNNKKLGAIQNEKIEISSFRAQLLSLLFSAVQLEFETLLKKSTGSRRKELDRMQKVWQKNNQAFRDVSLQNKEEYVAAHRIQVEAVQNDAEILRANVIKLKQDFDSLMQKYDSKEKNPAQQQLIVDLQKDISTEIKDLQSTLKELVSPTQKMIVMGYVDIDTTSSKKQHKRLIAKWKKLHEKDLRSYWSGTSSQQSILNQAWDILPNLFEGTEGFEDNLKQVQDRQLKKIIRLIEQEESRVVRLISDFQKTQGSVDIISLEASREGFKHIRDVVTQNILEADLGLVKIQWNRFTEKEQKLLNLKTKKEEEKRKQENEFTIINKKLPQALVNKAIPIEKSEKEEDTP
ncbi:MAG: hypothetical protein CL916_14740 [Deltaproteobacteria bacterium]|nr:hypothetical protein [Deltaproteobacteria bacterium]